MFGMSFSHILIVFVIVLLFGSKKLPELGSALGNGLRAFKKGLEGADKLPEDSNKDLAGHQNQDATDKAAKQS